MLQGRRGLSKRNKKIAEGGGKTLGQEGYGTSFNATEGTTDESSITESIVRYSERATAAEGKVQALEDRLNQMELGYHQPPPHMEYYSSESV